MASISKKEKLTYETMGEAFLFPRSRPKPWLGLGMEGGGFAQSLRIPWGIESDGKILKFARRRGIKIMGAREDAIPILPQKIGSLFFVFPLCSYSDPKKILAEGHRILKAKGKILIGFVPRNSPWGKFYLEQQNGRRPANQRARFYSVKEVEHMAMRAGFSIQGIVSTLFQKPGEVKTREFPIQGYRPQAGFLILIGEKLVRSREGNRRPKGIATSKRIGSKGWILS